MKLRYDLVCGLMLAFVPLRPIAGQVIKSVSRTVDLEILAPPRYTVVKLQWLFGWVGAKAMICLRTLVTGLVAGSGECDRLRRGGSAVGDAEGCLVRCCRGRFEGDVDDAVTSRR